MKEETRKSAGGIFPATETYRKIYIKSINDLPKEDNWYIAFSGVVNDFVHAHPTKSNWKDIDWYLQPDEPVEAEKKTAEQIFQEFIGDGQMGVDYEKRHIIEAIEYTLQSRSKQTYKSSPPIGSTTDFKINENKNKIWCRVFKSCDDLSLTNK